MPRLEPVIEQGPLSSTEGAQPDDAPKVFRQELAYHMAEPQDSLSFGYAKLVVTEAEVTRPGKALQAFQMITMMTPSLLGIPLEWYRTNVKAEVQIINSKGEIIGTYAGQGRSKVRVAMYHATARARHPAFPMCRACASLLTRFGLNLTPTPTRSASCCARQAPRRRSSKHLRQNKNYNAHAGFYPACRLASWAG
ncbi:hypothetical protein [Hymenobacter sp. AT01-02]|uniref:hypothetical protein n=1 Tax=Hymenobacter sp. AT01-02 TaxID=1571877 RepID=UPI0006E1ED2A|nr:hypothetical protein [Hymenobacter sp. AT01-02]